VRAFADRLQQPSTWAGLSALALLAGRADAAHALQLLGQSIPDMLAAAAALVAVVKNEKGAGK
jgi:F420-0:gamma-glutamyl ligase